MAARNILLTYDLKAKIADFGLSTRIYIQCPTTSTTRKGCKQELIPFRWAAYEVLETGTTFKEFSDVWSFGVLLWEIFHLGSAIPYGDKNDYEDVFQFLKDGHRLSKPAFCPEYVYDLMLDCWIEYYSCRPTFLKLKTKLETFNPLIHVVAEAASEDHVLIPSEGNENVIYLKCFDIDHNYQDFGSAMCKSGSNSANSENL